MLQTTMIYAAAATSAITLLAHIFVGTTKNAAPILDDGSLPTGPRVTLTFSWEANSVLLFFMMVGFLQAAYWSEQSLLVFNTLLAAALFLLSVLVTTRMSFSLVRFAPAPMFLLIAILGAVGIYG